MKVEQHSTSRALRAIAQKNRLSSLDVPVLEDAANLIDELQLWKDAVTDELVCCFILTAEHENNPKKALNDLAVWHQRVALDPAVSADAHALHSRIEALQDVLCFLDTDGAGLMPDVRERVKRVLYKTT